MGTVGRFRACPAGIGGRGTPGGPESSNPKRSYNPAFGEEASRKERRRHGRVHQSKARAGQDERRDRSTPPGTWKKAPTRGCCTWPTSSARWRRRWASTGGRGEAGPSDRWSPGERSGGTRSAVPSVLPGLPVEEEWLEPLGVLSLLVEGLFVGLSGHRAMEEYAPKIVHSRDTPTPVTGVWCVGCMKRLRGTDKEWNKHDKDGIAVGRSLAGGLGAIRTHCRGAGQNHDRKHQGFRFQPIQHDRFAGYDRHVGQ